MHKPIRDEKGQALILVLILLLVAGVIIAPLLAFMSTGLITQRQQEQRTLELYAADAGVEDALWKIKYLEEVPTNYSLTVNAMSVNVTIEEVTFLFGEELGGGVHYWIVELESELIDDPSDPDYQGDYTYRLTLTNKHNKNIGIDEIKISFSTNLDYPVGYQVDGLYNGDGVVLQKGDFADGVLTVTESGDNQILTWDFDQGETKIDGNPFADPSDPESWVTVSCIFQLVGFDDAPEISNFVLVGVSEDIGAVWEFKPFRITATAQAEDGSTVVVEAGVLESSDAVLVAFWESSVLQ
ncbi:hypothetical protein ES703_104143 [subsurface metagenome]